MSAHHESLHPRPWDTTTTDKIGIAGMLLASAIALIAGVRVDPALMWFAALIDLPSVILKVWSTRTKARHEREREAERERREGGSAG